MPLHHPNLTPDPAQAEASAFFTALMPKLMETQRDAISKVGGVYAFTITGDDRSEWTLDFDNGTILSSRDSTAPFHMTASADAFVAMLEGKLDVAEAILNDELQIDGDATLLRNVVAVLP